MHRPNVTTPNDTAPKTGADFKSKSGLTRIAKAAIYSWRGFVVAFRTEHAFRQELLLVLVLTPIALLLPVTWFERLMLFAAMSIVLITELLNSAIEAVVDKASPEIHPLAGRAKDMGSAAVFVSLVLTVLAWAVIAGPVVWGWLRA
jgi:diacylglycerol kinase (ATP)